MAVPGITKCRFLPRDPAKWNEIRRLSVCSRHRHQETSDMLAFEIGGGIFALLFLAAAMTGIEREER